MHPHANSPHFVSTYFCIFVIISSNFLPSFVLWQWLRRRWWRLQRRRRWGLGGVQLTSRHHKLASPAATIQTSDPQSMLPSQPPSRDVGDIHQPNELFVLFIKVRAWNRNIYFLLSNDLCGFTLESKRYDDFLTDLPVYLSNAKSSLVQTLSNDIIQTILSSYVKVNEMSSILSPSRDGWAV